MKTRSLVFFVLLLGLSTSLSAQSFYSRKGIGLVHYFVSGRSVAMGGVGLAFIEPMTVNYLNPAALAALPLTTVSGNFLHQAVDVNGASPDAFISDTNVAGLQFVIPIKKEVISISIGAAPYSRIQYGFSNLGSDGENSYRETVSGDGGVTSAFFSLAVRPVKRFYLGITGLFYFGRLSTNWRLDFVNSTLQDARDKVSRTFNAGNFRVGVLYKVNSSLNVAAVLSPSVTLDANKEVSTRFSEFTDFPNSDLELPLAFGLGTSWKLSTKILLGADYYTELWSKSNFQDEGIVNDSQRIALGIEFLPNSSVAGSYLSRVAYRAGFFYRDLGIEDPIGERVTEFFGSIGLGLPVRWRAGRIDLALEGGRRGSLSSNPIRETVVRVSASISVGQKWFYRGGRR